MSSGSARVSRTSTEVTNDDAPALADRRLRGVEVGAYFWAIRMATASGLSTLPTSLRSDSVKG